jgi:ribosomal protein S18 acetylase RimI-like enzyme
MDDDIAGYIKLSIAPPPGEIEEAKAVEIARIYVAKDKIGSGVGKRLMEFLFSFAREQNRNIIWLGVWEHNLRAINFYRKYGFVKFDEHIFMVGSDPQTDWLMKKELQPQ